MSIKRSSQKFGFACEKCGNVTPKWEGHCVVCGEWNTITAMSLGSITAKSPTRIKGTHIKVQELVSVSTDVHTRLFLSSAEVNRVLGGGLVPGSVTLIAGDPGIGKSTLLLRLTADAAAVSGTVLYVSGEESASQVKLRAERLRVAGVGLLFLSATDVYDVLTALEEHKPSLVVVDSIQTIFDSSLNSGPGSVAQIRECSLKLLEWAKTVNIPMILTGHVTKGGDIAGPRVLEHMVDVVLQMEGDPVSSWRLLRAVKNRFGSTNEVGVFEMSAQGLIDVEDPSRTFLSERGTYSIGSLVVSTMEGSRPLLVEVQALTNPSILPSPRRSATGIDFNRLLLLIAVLSRRAGVHLASQDVLVNVTGGMKVAEPAADLGVALAIVSSLRNVPIGSNVVLVGEIGLSGEVRSVPNIKRRIEEAVRLGFKRCVVPASSQVDGVPSIELVRVSTVSDAISACFEHVRPGP